MDDAKLLRFVCVRCGNCCTDKNTVVNLTFLDILRIKNGLNLDINEILDILGFYIFNKSLSDQERKKMVIPPIETEKGLAFIGLLKNSLGGCYFYDSMHKKCLIYNLRPEFCRTFPFSFKFLNESGLENFEEMTILYTEKSKQYCVGISSESPIINYEYWTKLGRKVLEVLKKNEIFIEDWNERVKKGEIEPTVKKYLLTIIKIS